MNQSQPQSSCPKGKETITTRSAANKKLQNNRDSSRSQRTYDFRNEQTVTIFHLLNKKGMHKLLKNYKPEEARKINDPKYCLYHKNIKHKTKDCYVLKDKIQTLIDAKVIQLRHEQKNVSVNAATMGSLKILVSTALIPTGKMVVKNYNPHNLKPKGLSPIFTKKGELIGYIHTC